MARFEYPVGLSLPRIPATSGRETEIRRGGTAPQGAPATAADRSRESYYISGAGSSSYHML